MEKLIPVVNKLQDIFQRCGLANPIDLPQIVVVGAQSSGKSSVLESIVGFDFLPRGAGVVTRRPTVIQLNKLKRKDSKTSELWVEFLHAPGKKFREAESIQREITLETERVAGKNKRLTHAALTLKVFSTDVVDLTLVDLPGLTRVPVGDQPADIERLARAMIYSYIEKPNALILAVHPANTDLATSDALQLARKVDPGGHRTLGVITKLDLMDAGTNALDMLQGRIIPLRRGYVGVVNRSQKDLDAHSSIARARTAEKEFFKSHPIYAPYAAKMGASYLARLLSRMLMEHIRNVLPQIRTQLTTHLTDMREQLAALGPVLPAGSDSAASLLHLLTRYAGAYANALDGRPAASVATSELAGGARISYIFYERFGRDLSAMDPFEGLGTDEIRTALRNATGHRTPLFIPESAFELLVRKQIQRFLDPSLMCVDLVYDELTRLAAAVESAELSRFRKLRDAVSDTTLKLLRERKAPTIEMVRNLVDMELSYINTWHPDFVGGRQALTASVAPPPPNGGTSSDQKPIQQPQPQKPRYEQSWVEKNLLGGARRNSERDREEQSNKDPLRGGRSGPFGGRGGNSSSSSQSRGLSAAVNSNGFGSAVVKSSGTTFAGIADFMPATLRVPPSEEVSEDEQQELQILRVLLESYFNLVRKRLQDMVPKAIITFLVAKSKERLQSILVSELYRPDTASKLLTEDGDTAQRRTDLQGIASMLEEALVQVGEVRDVERV